MEIKQTNKQTISEATIFNLVNDVDVVPFSSGTKHQTNRLGQGTQDPCCQTRSSLNL